MQMHVTLWEKTKVGHAWSSLSRHGLVCFLLITFGEVLGRSEGGGVSLQPTHNPSIRRVRTNSLGKIPRVSVKPELAYNRAPT